MQKFQAASKNNYNNGKTCKAIRAGSKYFNKMNTNLLSFDIIDLSDLSGLTYQGNTGCGWMFGGCTGGNGCGFMLGRCGGDGDQNTEIAVELP